MSVEHSLELLRRRIVCVLEEFDKDRQYPWTYVEKTGDGRFRAVTHHLCEGLGGQIDEAREREVGVYDTESLAIQALRYYAQVIRAMSGTPRTPDGRLDFNAPTVH